MHLSTKSRLCIRRLVAAVTEHAAVVLAPFAMLVNLAPCRLDDLSTRVQRHGSSELGQFLHRIIDECGLFGVGHG